MVQTNEMNSYDHQMYKNYIHLMASFPGQPG